MSCKVLWRFLETLNLPSGELTFCHGKSPFFMGKSTISTGPFSIAMLVHQRVSLVAVGAHHFIDTIIENHHFTSKSQPQPPARQGLATPGGCSSRASQQHGRDGRSNFAAAALPGLALGWGDLASLVVIAPAVGI